MTVGSTGPTSPLRRAVDALIARQQPDGAWQGEMVWCPVITAQYLLVARITGVELDAERRDGLVRYLLHTQRADGSWGMHDDAPGWLFVTGLAYVALRISGCDDPGVARARGWIRDQGGAAAIPTWGKLWLAGLGLYEWAGVQPILPELWLLPDASPVHPRRFYCHTRLVYLGLGVLCARRPVADLGPLRDALREELFPGGYAAVDWSAARGAIRADELYAPATGLLKGAYAGIRGVAAASPRWVRNKAVATCLSHIRHEQAVTGDKCISPVNALVNVLALFGEGDPGWRAAFDGLDHWLWIDEAGWRLVGARSQAWDTAFAVQALDAANGPGEPLRAAFGWLEANQVLGEDPEHARWYRDIRHGGWCFSDAAHAWPVSDCTAEVLVALRIIDHRLRLRLPQDRVEAAVAFVLSRQNADGGFGSYEAQRGGALFDDVNPTEMYGRCMTERSYVECTASCVRGLLAGIELGVAPELADRARLAIDRGLMRLRAVQNPDGSWTGVWGIQFTYGTWFAVHAMRDAGVPASDPAIRRAAAWLRGAAMPGGGWSETWQSCLDVRFEAADSPHAVQTAWALLGLAACGETSADGTAALLAMQRADGDWPEQQVEGVFFNTSALRYRMYRTTFPLWALAAASGAVTP